MPVPKTAPADAGAAETLGVDEESGERAKRKRSPEQSPERFPAHPDGGATTKEEEEAKSPPPGSKTSYECRFCLMKFEKSQALGGHMNRHRQEREKEQYQEAEELIKSRAQQQMHRNWTSFSTTEIPQLNPDPGALSRMTGQLRSGATRPHAPPISFGSYNRGQAPTSIVSNPSSLLSNYMTSNSSSCNNNNNVQQQQHQQQNLHQWNGDGYSLAALPRSVPQAGNYAVETMISTSLQATVIPPELFANMFRASALNNNHHPSNNINSSNNINNNSNINNNNNNVNRSSHINNDSDNINNDSNINNSDNNNNGNNDSSLVPSGTPTNTPQCIYDLYSSYPNSFYGGM